MTIFEQLLQSLDDVPLAGFASDEAARLEAARGSVKLYLQEAKAYERWWDVKPQDLPIGNALLSAEPAAQVSILSFLFLHTQADNPFSGLGLLPLIDQLSRRRLPFTETEMVRLTSIAAPLSERKMKQVAVQMVEGYIAGNGMSAPLRAAVEHLRDSTPPANADFRKLLVRINALFGAERTGVLKPGEPWGDAVLAELAALPPNERSAWNALLAHALGSESTRPSKRWLTAAATRVEALGKECCRRRMLSWFGLFQDLPPAWTGPTHTYEEYEEKCAADGIVEYNSAALKGLVWCCLCLEENDIPSALGDLAQAALRKIPGVGPKSAKVGNACVVTLGMLPGMAPVAQLSRLKMRIKYQDALGLIEKALTAAAARADLPPEDLEELAVPTLGLDDEGCLRQEFGPIAAQLSVAGTCRVEPSWTDQNGKPVKSVPAEVRRDHAEAIKTLKQTVEEINKTLPAQRDRMERLMLSGRNWTLREWRERYLDHPLLGSLSRRLIWRFTTEGHTRLGIWWDGRLADETGRVLDALGEQTRVQLWHPLGFTPETVLMWRRWLEDNGISQPFKQAHREIYLLTDAERTTRSYSNRFAAHVIRQHQFTALCRQRNWRYQLQGRFDGYSVPTLLLPQENMRVEFWVEPVAEDALSESMIYVYLSTDQVRFYGPMEQLVPLEQVPALVFSEVMRDVDLFVGVCSIGNDPEWHDAGEGGQGERYWQGYAFGDLGASAKTRQDVLSRLLPRLKIAPQCRLDEKFLRVQGKLRAYKIHLGSGNILMEPNDQYLCIVPDRRTTDTDTRAGVFLPFEGDRTLSVILSKAFLLADDANIKDPTILRQIRQ